MSENEISPERVDMLRSELGVFVNWHVANHIAIEGGIGQAEWAIYEETAQRIAEMLAQWLEVKPTHQGVREIVDRDSKHTNLTDDIIDAISEISGYHA